MAPRVIPINWAHRIKSYGPIPTFCSPLRFNNNKNCVTKINFLFELNRFVIVFASSFFSPARKLEVIGGDGDDEDEMGGYGG